MQHYGVNGYSLHAMNSLSAMYNLHQQAAQQAQHTPDYRPSVHALTLAERLAGKNNSRLLPFPGKKKTTLLLALSETLLQELECDIANWHGVLLNTMWSSSAGGTCPPVFAASGPLHLAADWPPTAGEPRGEKGRSPTIWD